MVAKTNVHVSKYIYIISKYFIQRWGNAKMVAQWLQNSAPCKSSGVYINYWYISIHDGSWTALISAPWTDHFFLLSMTTHLFQHHGQ